MKLDTVWQDLNVALGVGRSIPSALMNRERLSIDEIKSRFYKDVPITVAELRELWSDVAGTFQVDPTVVRPTDRFEHELPLNTFFGVNDEDVILGGCISRRMSERGMAGPTPNFKTVDEYIRFFASRMTD